MRQAQTPVVLGICQSDESSLCVQWVTIDSLNLHAEIEDSDHTELGLVNLSILLVHSHIASFLMWQLKWGLPAYAIGTKISLTDLFIHCPGIRITHKIDNGLCNIETK